MSSQNAKGLISILLASFLFGFISAFAIMFSILFLNEVLTIQFIFGALLVFGSSLYLIGREESWVKI